MTKGPDDLLPFGLPAIYDDLQDILEQYLKDPSGLPMFSLDASQEKIETQTDVKSLYIPYQPPPTAPYCKFRPVRDMSTGKILDLEEIFTADHGSAVNSTSLKREPGAAKNSVRGSTSNLPFLPGGFDVDLDSILNETKDTAFVGESLENLEPVDLEYVPPGFDDGLLFYGDLSAQKTNAKKRDERSLTSVSVEAGQVDLTALLSHGDHPDWCFDDEVTEKKPESEKQSVNAAKGLDDASVDAIVDSSVQPTTQVSPVDVIKISASLPSDSIAAKQRRYKFARILDATRPVLDFSRAVPHPAHTWPFRLDPFQEQAVLCLEKHNSVMVAAHTSAGKTVVAEYAIALALNHVTRVIYTSPVKALSNQKYRDFKETFKDVGLLTGDVQINTHASCLVMTTEILRSMLYNGSDVVRELEWVVFDEVHYINDRERGVVWEEILILLPDHVGLVLLSATVPNAYELADWIGRIKKREIFVVSTDRRPVPLEHHLWTNTSTIQIRGVKKTANGDSFMIVDSKSNFLVHNYKNAVEAKKKDNTKEADNKPGGPNKQQPRPPPKYQHRGNNHNLSPKEEKLLYVNLVRSLEAKDKLPVIVFTLSRVRCDGNASNMPETLDLLTATESRESVRFFRSCLARLKGSDRDLPQIRVMEGLLRRGIGIHHSGILPILKEVVELLFARGLVKLLFATETFAMGVNMPARTVVFDSIRKHDGTQFRILLPSEYIQMAGRAGRRGLDATGTVIILCKTDVWESGTLQQMMLGQATILQSQFRVTYAMILNLKRTQSVQVVDMMKRSFGESRKVEREGEHREKLEKLKRSCSEFPGITCDVCSPRLPDFYEYLKTCWTYWADDLGAIVAKHALVSKFLAAGRLVSIRLPETDPVWSKAGDGAGFPAIVLELPGIRSKYVSVLYLTSGSPVSPAPINHQAARFASIKCDGVNPVKKLSSDWNVPAVAEVDFCDIAAVSKNRIIKVGSFAGMLEDWRKNKLKRSRDAEEAVLALRNSVGSGTQWCDAVKDLGMKELTHVERYRFFCDVRASASSSGAHDCPVFSSHFAQFFESKKLEEEKEAVERLLSEQSLLVYPEYRAKLDVLSKLGYLNKRQEVRLKGRVACAMFQHELMLTEILFQNVLADFQPAEIAALLSCLVFQGKNDVDEESLSPQLARGVKAIKELARQVGEVQRDCGLDEGPNEYCDQFKFGLVNVVHQWAKGVPFADIAEMTDVQEGIVIRNIQRLDEVMRDCQNAAKTVGDPRLYEKMVEASNLIKRDIVFAASLYTQDI